MDWIAQVLWLSSTRALAEHSQLLPYLELENVMRLFWLWFLALACSTWLFSRRESVQHPSGFAPKGEYEEVIKAKGQTPSKWAAKTRVFWTEEIGGARVVALDRRNVGSNASKCPARGGFRTKRLGAIRAQN